MSKINNIKKRKGSLTIEAALIMPIIVFGILLLIFTTLLLYSRVSVSIAINRVVNTISGQYYDPQGYYSFTSTGGVIHQAVNETFKSKTEKTKKIKERLVYEVKSSSPVKLDIDTSQLTVDIKNKILWQEINIAVPVEYPLILPGIFNFFSSPNDGSTTPGIINSGIVDGKYKETFYKQVCVSNTENNIRTIKYMGDKANQLVEEVEGRDNFAGRFVGVITRIKEGVDRFLTNP